MTDQPDSPPPFAPGELRRRARAVAERALRAGALLPIATDATRIEADGITWPVRILARLEAKEAARRLQQTQAAKGGRLPDPFLPPEPDLTVGPVSPTHTCVLNKFRVIDDHLLIVTNHFEHQECLLTADDFDALWRCMAGFGGLGFYNGGEVAGASQPHKHLQLVPLPLDEGLPHPVPVQPLLPADGAPGVLRRSPRLPFCHAWVRLGFGPDTPLAERVAVSLDQYRWLLAATGVDGEDRDGCHRQTRPYNLLVTEEWMLVVPRAREDCRGISINALGYAGGFLVRDEVQLDTLRRVGPLRALRETGLPPCP